MELRVTLSRVTFFDSYVRALVMLHSPELQGYALIWLRSGLNWLQYYQIRFQIAP